MDGKETTIENRLKELRKQHSLSQEDLAEELGISRQSIIALEQGHSLPSLSLAVSMCKFFDSAFEEVFAFEREIDKQIGDAISQNNIKINVINNSGGPISQKLCEVTPGKGVAMVELEPWRPFQETVSLRDAMDRLLEDSFITPVKGSGGMPKIDIRDKKGNVIVRAELPGIEEDDITVEILDDVMTISGEKKEEKGENPPAGGGYYYKESHSGAFSRSFSLPSDVVAEKASADMKNGVMTITIPKVEPKKALKVKVGKNKTK